MTAIKLTRDQVLAIRAAYENRGHGGASMNTLAVRFGTTSSTVHRVLTGEHPFATGLPNISGTRGGGDMPGWGSVAARRRRERINPEPMGNAALTRAQRIRSGCEECGARPNEKCHNRKAGSIVRPLKALHESRGRGTTDAD